MKNRSRTDIIVAILETAMGGSSKTKIMYDAYVSYSQLKDYLSMLIAKGLLEPIEEENLYKTTRKGMKFTRLCHNAGGLIGLFQELKN
jgi:predicted transcriptional regulator